MLNKDPVLMPDSSSEIELPLFPSIDFQDIKLFFPFVSISPQKPAGRGFQTNEYADAQLQEIVKKLRERANVYKEKLNDPVISSPEASPPVCKCL